MASSEQPLKKRKLYDLPPEPPSPATQPQSTVVQPQTPPPLSQDEILARRRNKDEIRSVYDCYKKLKGCIATKDVRHLPEIEQTYLSLISASRGCLSVQRIVADLIPRYASYCPTALEAAIKVVINMHNWCLAVINRGEDADGVAFETAKACIFGLADICHVASSEAPTSSVIRGICSAVFHNVLEFFISSSDGEDLIHTVDECILKIIVSDEILPRLKQKISDEDEASLIKLAKFRGLSLLQIFIFCPKNLLAACLELFNPAAQEGVHKGLYLLTQFIRRLDDDGAAHPSVKKGTEAISVDINTNAGGGATSEEIVSGDKYAVVDASKEPKSCILGLVLSQNPSLRRWFSLRYKKLCKLSSSIVVSEIRSILEGLLGSFPELSKVEEREVESDEDGSYPSNHVQQQYLLPGFSNEHEISREQYQKDSSRIHTGSYGSSNDSGGTRSVDFEASDHVNLSCGRSSMPRELSNPQMLSPGARRPLYNRNNSFDGRNHGFSERSVGGCSSNTLVSPNHHLSVPYASTPTPIHWYFDGDPAAMDIVSASRHLWLGLFGPDASEAHIRFHLERFGPLEQFLFLPIKRFALAEYRNIIDAIRTREYIRGHFPWCIKFMDRGLGTRGAINGLAVGSSSYVYVGNVPNQWARDEILHESSKAVCKGPYMVTDLSCEGALLIEFETPEEATSAMAHLRQHRQSKSSCLPTANAGPLNATMSHIDYPRPLHPASIHVDFRSNHPSNMPASVYGSPHGSSFHSASQPGMMHHGAPFSMRPEGSSMQLVSPCPRSENQGTAIQGGHPLQSNWTTPGYTDMHEVGARNIESHDNNIMINSSQGGNLPCPPIATQGHIPPPQQIQPSPFMRPAYLPPNSPWDARSSNHQMPLNPAPSSVMPNTFHGNTVAAPFIPPSVTPLAQIQGASLQNFDPVFSHPIVPPPLLSQPPPQPEEPPPSPPPLPESQPPLAPPPPSSPPPPPVVELMAVESCGQLMQYQWRGALCKSGVHYSTVFAQRENSDICKYSQAIAEPHEWPAKLDMTKRTDYQHVKSTFANTPPHKREVCRLIPSSVGDLKGFQDFVSYLKQRECAGVIKIPAVKPIWSRLLFILPYSQDMCSMLGITPNPSDCLIALVLPKETHSEYA